MRGYSIVLLVFCLLILQADGQTTTSTDRLEIIEDLSRVDSFLPETK